MVWSSPSRIPIPSPRQCNETLRDRWHDKHYDADGNFVPGHDHWEKHKQADGWRDNAFHSTVEMTRVLASIGLPAVQTSGNALGAPSIEFDLFNGLCM